MVRLTSPLDLRSLSPGLLAEIAPLHSGGRFELLLRERPEALVVVALDATGALGWAAAEPDGLLGCYVHPKHRRHGIGTALLDALLPAAAILWPGVAWRKGAQP